MNAKINFNDCTQKIGELLGIVKDGVNQKVNIEIDKYRVTVKGAYGDVLRLKSNMDRELILESIDLENKRIGVGTNILKWLKKYGKENGFKILTVESVITEKMNDFCKKNNLNKSNLYENDINYYVKL